MMQSSQRVSGNIEAIDSKIHSDEGESEEEDETQESQSTQANARYQGRGFQLIFRNNHAVWREF